MILVFGGTTEGRKAAEVLEEAGTPYYYSTKTGEQDITLHHGVRTDGALDGEAMVAFCRGHAIRLLVDAAHPFAERLHRTISDVARQTHIPVVRYERIYPPRDPALTWIDDYGQLATLTPRPATLLATTGVQSIGRLKPLEAGGMKIYYRILPRESSRRLAYAQGATDDQLCYYEDGSTVGVEAEAMLLKESGLSGGFAEKVDAALSRGMRVIVLMRPVLPAADSTVNGPHGLRRAVERLLPEFFPLHSGLTTGTCATAAAMAATRRLLTGETPAEVGVRLPDGETIPVAVGYGDGFASCTKVSGDDPDVTDGLEIRATAERSAAFAIKGGAGVGRFTLPGFDYPPGEAAINKGPRQMMRDNIDAPVTITVSVPGGEEIARKTFNPRLGIEGGISIIGVSGIVKPFSEEAFISSIRKCMEVAKASGSPRVVINSGAKSERFVRGRYPDLPRQAFVEYGNYIGETLRMAHALGIGSVTLGVMLGKAVKLAEGHLDTHSRRATMNLGFVQQLLDEAGVPRAVFTAHPDTLTLARELWERIPPEYLPRFARTVISHCAAHCQPLLPDGQLTVLLIDEQGGIYA